MNNKSLVTIPFLPLDRIWINVALKVQRLQLVHEINWRQAYDDAFLLQELASGLGELPGNCYICGENTNDCNEVIKDSIDFGVGSGMPTEVEYTCKLCEHVVAYWAHGNWEPRS